MHISDQKCAYLKAMGIPLWKERVKSARCVLITKASLPPSLVQDLQRCNIQVIVQADFTPEHVNTRDRVICVDCAPPSELSHQILCIGALDKPESKQQLWLVVRGFNDDA